MADAARETVADRPPRHRPAASKPVTSAITASLIFGLAALLLYIFAEAVFEVMFGYIGASVVWLLTFGRVRMDPRDERESALAAGLGVVFTAFGLTAGVYLLGF